MDPVDSASSKHPIFTADPQRWMDLVYHNVYLKTCDEKLHTGVVYTIDPVSESVVLLKIDETALYSIEVIIGSAVVEIKKEETVSDAVKIKMDKLFRPDFSGVIDETTVLKRKDDLKSWLERHRLPVEYSDVTKALTVAGVLVVNQPYTANDCLSTNEIILERIQGLIDSMPDDML